MMRRADKDDGAFVVLGNAPCAARLDTAEEDVDDHAPEDHGEVEGLKEEVRATLGRRGESEHTHIIGRHDVTSCKHAS